MRVLSDRLYMHLDSVWKHKEIEKIDVISREKMEDMWHLVISALYGVSTWGKGEDSESYSSANMMMNLAWWRLFSDMWDKLPLPVDARLTQVLDQLMINITSTTRASRYINHIGVYFLQHILIENSDLLFIKTKFKMEKVHTMLLKIASMGETFYFFEPNNRSLESKHATVYLNMYNLIGIQNACGSGSINPSLGEIYKNKQFLEKKKYSN
jgi:hypothetical protein